LKRGQPFSDEAVYKKDRVGYFADQRYVLSVLITDPNGTINLKTHEAWSQEFNPKGQIRF
jgi:hypothetical protein